MQWTSTDAVRRWLVVAGLVAGPVLVAASALVGLTGAQAESMRESFDVMADRSGAILAQGLLETIGFTIVFAALVGAMQALRARGGALGTAGAVLSMAGIAGFGLSNGSGLAVVALTQLPDRDAAFQAATAISSDGPIAVAGTVGWMLEIAGQLGLLLALAGLWRARIVPPWPLVLGVIGMAANAAIGTVVATLAADVLLLAAGVWVAVLLARTAHETWLGAAAAPRRATGNEEPVAA